MLDSLLNPVNLILLSFAATAVAGIVFGLLLPAEQRTRKIAVAAGVSVFAVPALLFAGVTLSVQGVKAEALATDQANIASEALQSETAFLMAVEKRDDVWKKSPIVDAALSDDLKNGFTAETIEKLNAGESLSFTSDSGKKVELSLEPGSKEGRVNVVLTYDGKRVESDSLNGFKASDKVGKSWESSWIDKYPTLVKAPAVGKSA